MPAETLYLLSYGSGGKEGVRELAEAECHTLTGASKAAERVFIGSRASIAHSAYVKSACHVLAQGGSIDECCSQLREQQVAFDSFQVTVAKVPASVNVHSVQAASAIGECVRGRADLCTPETHLLVVATPERVWVGEVVERGEQRCRRFARKPCGSVRGLPADVARAALNLVAQPGNTLLDPCCGAGTALIEAFDLGLRPTGLDLNPKLVEAANRNLAHFGMPPVVEIGDARECTAHFDAVIADLPYGHLGDHADAATHDAIAQHVVTLAPRAVIITNRRMDFLTQSIDSRPFKVLRTPVTRTLTRFFHVIAQ